MGITWIPKLVSMSILCSTKELRKSQIEIARTPLQFKKQILMS